MNKVFISYNKADLQWAEWIGWQLEEEGYEIILQAWDFRPGCNFVMEMQTASTKADRTIAILSPDYLEAKFTMPEWAAAFAQDPTGEKGILLPVLVRMCDLTGLLGQIVYINLVGLEEGRARDVLIKGINRQRAKPETAPRFPGKRVLAKKRHIDKKPVYPLYNISTYKMPTTGEFLFGREGELMSLDEAWNNEHIHIVSLVAWGGVGKTALVNRWLSHMEKDNYRGANRVYAWSFYSQGAEEGKQASADEFMQETLKWFGDPAPTAGSAVDKGRRLARLVRDENTLLILDGMEPLQYPPGQVHGLDGRLKDHGMRAFLRELAGGFNGLCMITSRERVTDLADKKNFTMKEMELDHLSFDAGAELLKRLGVKGSDKDILKAAKEYAGHALAITLLGHYITSVYKGDIRKRDRIPQLTRERLQGGHARRVMEAYEKWLGQSAEKDILYIMGLFDRPVDIGAVEALKAEPAIPGVTDQLQQLSGEDWNRALFNLRAAHLLAAENPQKPDVLDCHPLIREHFGEKHQKQNPKGWKESHKRLYHYFKNLPKKELPDTLQEMEPLFAAVAHGCRAGLYNEARYDVYWKRIRRGKEAYTVHKLGAFGSDLAALSNFFEVPWNLPVAELKEEKKALVLSWAAFRLRALGRLREAIQPMKAGLEMSGQQEDWEGAAQDASNLSELMLTLGEVKEAVAYGSRSVTYADRSGDAFMKEASRTTHADALHQRGQLEEAEVLFREAEALQRESQPEYPFLYSLQGYQFCDLLLGRDPNNYQEVMERANQGMKAAKEFGFSLLTFALGDLTLGRAWTIKAEKEGTRDFHRAMDYLDRAVEGLREAQRSDYLPRALLARAACFRLQENVSRAWEDLNEAKEIAELGEMKRHLVDYHI